MLRSSWRLIYTVLDRTDSALFCRAEKHKLYDKDSIEQIAMFNTRKALTLVNNVVNEGKIATKYDMEVLYQQMDTCLCGILQLEQTLPYDNLIVMAQLCLNNIRYELELMK